MNQPAPPRALALLLGAWACGDTPAAPLGLDGPVPSPVESRAPKKLGPDVCAFGQPFSLDPGNPWYPLTPGSYWILEGEEDGTRIRLRIEVMDATEDVGGVTTRVLVETEWEDGNEDGVWEDDDLVEISTNYFAGTADGTVCYFGEAVDDYEDGEIVSHEGEWRADEAGHWPGTFMPADPVPGVRFQLEGAPGIAEDEGRIVGVGPITVAAGTFPVTLRLREYNPLDEEKDYKVFASGVGTIVDGPLALVEYDVQ
ncbi:MAG: hypothetical protein PVI57_18510 [Gemmatimonadota bacterium]|jgi:hypothetical protein